MIRQVSVSLAVTAMAATLASQSFGVPLAPGAISQQNLTVAHDAGTGAYLVASEDNWIQSGLGFINSLDAVLIDPATGSSRLIANIASEQRLHGVPPFGAKHRVGNIKQRRSFVVVWQDAAGSLRARSVDAVTGAVSPRSGRSGFLVDPGLWNPSTSGWHDMSPDVGGDSVGAVDTVIVVWNTITEIKAALLAVSATGALSKPSEVVLMSGTPQTINAPAISRSGGESGRYLVSWQSAQRVRGVVIDRSLAVLASFSETARAAPGQGDRLATDGDTAGGMWLLAYGTGGNPGDVVGRTVSYFPASSQVVVGAEVNLAAEPGQDETQPTVAYAGGSYLIGYVINAGVGSMDELHVKSVDPFTCAPCEGDFTVRKAVGLASPAIAGELSASLSPAGSRELSMMVWQERGPSPNFNEEGHGLMVPADDGVVVDLGGGCGAGGRAWAACSITGNRGFALRLTGAAPSSAAFAVLASGTIGAGAPCGPCALVPDPSAGVVVPVATSALGRAALEFSLPSTPSLVGQAFYQQWLVATGAGGCFGLDMSNSLQVELQ